jgi:hypothetical protein
VNYWQSDCAESATAQDQNGMKKQTKPAKTKADAIAQAIATSDDFGHEMRVRAVLNKHRAQVQHGWVYLDPIEGKPRLFDFRAKLYHPTQLRRLQFAVECKNISPDVPLVISGTARAQDEAFHDFIAFNGEKNYAQVRVLRAKADQLKYPFGEFVGKSVLRLKPDKDGGLVQSSNHETEIYQRWVQALASADALCKAAAVQDGRDTVFQTVVLPMVVVPDATLWTVNYDATGAVVGAPTPTEATTLFFNHEVVVVPNNHWTNFGHVHFFTLTGFHQFLAEQTVARSWNDWFPTTAVQHQPPVH